MAASISSLPSMTDGPFLTDGGLETTLVFHDGIDLPCFAAFPLLRDEKGRGRIERYYEPYIRMALARRIGFLLDTPTWRANRDWGARLGYSPEDLEVVNREVVRWARSMSELYATPDTPIVVNGVIGPRGDGYRPGSLMSPDQAQDYHAAQVSAFRDAGADMASAMTINYAEEAIGIVRAAGSAGLPIAVSFTVETDGSLATGDSLADAIRRVDDATHGGPAYYMINCAHPDHFEDALGTDGSWIRRVGGIRANASTKSHAELDESLELDIGDPADLGRRYRALRDRMGHLRVLGGCCGTDHRHIAAICEACLP
ncbi:homocysteine S-methyltransferase family protein [Microvirga pudoricolor]|uniref:homocysteine S-methyltransferase family protein n=1 Tax=Microvirga pudoricolor TaxID=2778729 RepID=UPI00194DD66E|nr:homocysteine S-methyltransferase family protein [Microvirga pudoricolor]MBM6592884.1 homocysteine S-methyltransferase family protein [Microvirga pudoricolor]